jgi:hypothetical protein
MADINPNRVNIGKAGAGRYDFKRNTEASIDLEEAEYDEMGYELINPSDLSASGPHRPISNIPEELKSLPPMSVLLTADGKVLQLSNPKRFESNDGRINSEWRQYDLKSGGTDFIQDVRFHPSQFPIKVLSRPQATTVRSPNYVSARSQDEKYLDAWRNEMDLIRTKAIARYIGLQEGVKQPLVEGWL